ncbi:SAC3 family protein A isoform X2 [Cryptomeria japonica]|uniref:SAC3 family protein A isoform X2 n=1 Tax=Cryptomeria japonica TaxID=3369 RepID=UPI0027DA9BE8|nr:SAC3 family protein A isoform X2 [Cryptomeria japonica]
MDMLVVIVDTHHHTQVPTITIHMGTQVTRVTIMAISSKNSEGYQSTGLSGHASSWSDNGYGNYGGYPNYPGFTPSDQTQVDYQQWEEYYRHSGSDVSCAPGTESIVSGSKSTPPSLDCPIPGVSNSSAPITQPPPPGTQQSWQSNIKSYCEAPLSQNVSSVGVVEHGYGVKDSTTISSYQSEQYNQPGALHFQQVPHRPYFQQPLQLQVPQYHQVQEKEHTLASQGQKAQTLTTVYQASQNLTSSVQPMSSSQKKIGKLQIPTNPKIAPNSAFGLKDVAKKNAQGASPSPKPAYTSVNVKSINQKASSNDVADAMLKPGMFPPSLFHYVERALARCKDEAQKTACQDIMKQMITKASADGSLFTRDWDTEPLFPLPSSNMVASMENMQCSLTVGSLQKSENSHGKRFKSRWEPVVEEKLEKKHVLAVNHEFIKEDVLKEGQSKMMQTSLAKWNTMNGVWNKSKQLQLQEQFDSSKMPMRPSKKARKVVDQAAGGCGDNLSDNEEEAGQGGHCFGSRELADTLEEEKRRESRSRRFDKGNGSNITSRQPGITVSGAVSAARTASALLLARNYGDAGGRAVEDIDWDSLTVKGTCQEIEKRYLRLTSAPDPNTVRPEEVLQEALAMVQSSTKNYLYKCDQLKSIRQDLTVQRIRNEFTARVYETHARLALEAGDMSEFNQCQSQLEGLYAEGIKGCHHEFAAYKLLYRCLNLGNTRDLLSSMARLSIDAKSDDVVKHALAVRAAVSSGNYTSFFRLYRTASTLSACLMDLYVEKMRFKAVRCISRSYRPTVPVAFMAQILGFTDATSFKSSDEIDGIDECEEWLRAHGAIVIRDKSTGELQLNAKDTASSLFMPEPEDAVPHGDVYLGLNDFFARA